MQVTETKNEGLSREFSVRVMAGDIAEKVEARLEEIGKDVTIPGFRPGKVPTKILRQRYGKAVMGEILESAIQDTSQQAIAERGLTPAMQPKITEFSDYEDGKDLEYKMQVEIMPEFEPTDFAKIELEKIAVKVSDKEIDEALQRLAAQNRIAEPVAKPRKAKNGDVVVIDFVGRADGTEFPGGTGKDFNLELGSGQFIPGFEEQLVGAKPGDNLEVNVTFPADYNAPGLAGKDASFEVTLTEIREYKDAVVGDDMATNMGFENLSKLREAVQGNMEGEYAAMSRTSLKRRLLDKLSELHDFEVPAGMVDAEFDAIWRQFEQAREQGNIDEDDIDKDDEELKSDYRAIAERRVRLGLLLNEVGRRNSIEISAEEVNRAIMAEAQRYRGHEREVVEHYQNNPQARAELQAPLFENKVVDFVLEMAKITEKAGTMEDLIAAEQAEAKTTAKKSEGKKAKSPKPGAKKAAASKSDDKKKADTKKVDTKKKATPAKDKK
jgi:trigger factor